MVKGRVSLIDLEEFYTRWRRLLPLSSGTGPHAIPEQLLSKLLRIKEQVLEKEAKVASGNQELKQLYVGN